MSKYQVTLSRAHKIAERLASRLGELRAEAEKLAESSTLTGYSDAQIKRLGENGKRAVALINEQEAAVAALVAVRSAVGKANAAHGITDALAQIEGNKKLLAGVEAILKSQDETTRGGLVRIEELSDYKTVGNTEGALRSSYINVSVLTDAQVADLAERKKKLERANFTLNDKLADLNGKLVELTIEAPIAEFLGL